MGNRSKSQRRAVSAAARTAGSGRAGGNSSRAGSDKPGRKPPKTQIKASLPPETAQGRLDHGPAVAVIDIGSNSIRLVIYEGIARSPTVLFNEKLLAGLGRGIVSTGKRDPEAVTRAIAAVRDFGSA